MRNLCGVLALLLLIPHQAPAQDIEARLYANAPDGTNFAAVGYKYSRGDIVVNSVLLEDLRGDINAAVLGYARAFSLAGGTAKFDLLVPHLWMEASGRLSGVDTSRTWNGFGDPTFRLTWDFLGAPALAPAEFVKWRQKTIAGASFMVMPPLGKYDSTRLMNLGSNRWTLKGEVAVSRAIRRWILEAYASLYYFTDNTDYFGGSTLAQEPVGAFQVHVIYTFQPGMWLGFDWLYASGGETSVDGVPKNDFQANTRMGVTFAMPVVRHHNIKFTWSSGVATRIGGDFDSFALSYLHDW